MIGRYCFSRYYFQVIFRKPSSGFCYLITFSSSIFRASFAGGLCEEGAAASVSPPSADEVWPRDGMQGGVCTPHPHRRQRQTPATPPRARLIHDVCDDALP